MIRYFIIYDTSWKKFAHQVFAHICRGNLVDGLLLASRLPLCTPTVSWSICRILRTGWILIACPTHALMRGYALFFLDCDRRRREDSGLRLRVSKVPHPFRFHMLLEVGEMSLTNGLEGSLLVYPMTVLFHRLHLLPC